MSASLPNRRSAVFRIDGFYVIKSTSEAFGLYQVTFAAPCGKKDLIVTCSIDRYVSDELRDFRRTLSFPTTSTTSNKKKNAVRRSPQREIEEAVNEDPEAAGQCTGDDAPTQSVSMIADRCDSVS